MTRRSVSKSFPSFVAALALAVAAAGPGLSAEGALYDAAPPADAVFVRLVAPQGQEQGLTLAFGGREITLRAADAPAYVALSAGDLAGIPAGGFYSVAVGPDGAPRIIAEPDRDGALKVHLFVLNTGDAPVRLVVPAPEADAGAGAGAEVVAPVAPGAAASRAVNPVQATLAVERVSDGAELARFDVALRRGQNLTFVSDGATARLIENAFGPVAPRD